MISSDIDQSGAGQQVGETAMAIHVDGFNRIAASATSTAELRDIDVIVVVITNVRRAKR
jgi:hypothetical protein